MEWHGPGSDPNIRRPCTRIDRPEKWRGLRWNRGLAKVPSDVRVDCAAITIAVARTGEQRLSRSCRGLEGIRECGQRGDCGRQGLEDGSESGSNPLTVASSHRRLGFALDCPPPIPHLPPTTTSAGHRPASQVRQQQQTPQVPRLPAAGLFPFQPHATPFVAESATQHRWIAMNADSAAGPATGRGDDMTDTEQHLSDAPGSPYDLSLEQDGSPAVEKKTVVRGARYVLPPSNPQNPVSSRPPKRLHCMQDRQGTLFSPAPVSSGNY